jgi:hypothetical protein
VEAYPDFQRTVFEIRDASCGALLGIGAAYRPIGVYFRAVYAEEVALADLGVHVCVAAVSGPPPPLPPPPGDAGSAKVDAGRDAGGDGGDGG